jgi:transposase
MPDNVLGLDVSAATLHAYLLCGTRGRHHTVSNDAAGHAALEAWLRRQPQAPTWICCEATGTYHLACARALHAAGWALSVVNPARIKAYARAEGLRAKTDRVDARLIARFAQQAELRRWEPEAQEITQLRALLHRLESLERMHTQERNRLAAPELPACVQDSCQRLVAALEAEQAQIETQIQTLIAQHDSLRALQERLDTIPGVGAKTAAVLTALLLSRPFHRARQVAAYAGLTPYPRQSGTSVHVPARITKQGPSYLRHALYFPALAAKRTNPLMQPLVTRLTEEGRPKKQIIVAVMRKLLHQAFGLYKYGTDFNPHYHPAARGDTA